MTPPDDHAADPPLDDEPVTRYPDQADPANPDGSEPAEVTGTPTDPLPRELHVDNTRPQEDEPT